LPRYTYKIRTSIAPNSTEEKSLVRTFELISRNHITEGNTSLSSKKLSASFSKVFRGSYNFVASAIDAVTPDSLVPPDLLKKKADAYGNAAGTVTGKASNKIGHAVSYQTAEAYAEIARWLGLTVQLSSVGVYMQTGAQKEMILHSFGIVGDYSFSVNPGSDGVKTRNLSVEFTVLDYRFIDNFISTIAKYFE
jgi:hypothetical protein